MKGVESVEDEWERELEAEEDLDLLFVKYDPQVVTLDDIQEVIGKHQFQVEVRSEN